MYVTFLQKKIQFPNRGNKFIMESTFTEEWQSSAKLNTSVRNPQAVRGQYSQSSNVPYAIHEAVRNGSTTGE